MWLKQGLNGTDLTEDEFQKIKEGKHSERIEANRHDTINHEVMTQPRSKCSARNSTSTQYMLLFVENKHKMLSFSGQKSVQFTSESIDKEMNIKNRMPYVCSAMREAMKSGDRIIYAPPKGNCITLTIEYKL